MCTWWSQNKNELKRKKKDTCKNICNVLGGDLFWKKRFFMNILDGNAFMGLEKEFSLYIKRKTSINKNEIKIPSVLKNTNSDTCTLYNMNIKPSQT